MDLFGEVRRLVSMEEAARRYGFEPDRQRKIRCPFHEDSHPSLQLYHNGRGWWWYVCDQGGSVIDFVSRLFSISPREAALKLNGDFSLGLAAGPARRLEARARQHAAYRRRQREQAFESAYLERQREFIDLRQELFMLPRGGRAGELLGRLDELEHWFRENPWR